MKEKETGSVGSPPENKVEKRKEGKGGEDCRCREVSKKSFPQLIRLMLDDLSFRKKGRR